jgi:nitroimidazol reductase NimA-like FMN-containing flavoprotein (pyridoxamine 5'-phosphate oxidase superfamily)
MAEQEPRSADLLAPDATTLLPWSEARRQLADARFYWLATVHSDGRPHVRPVLAVWVDDSMYSTSNPTARKAKNLALDSRCALTVRSDGMDLVLEGNAVNVSDDATLQRVAAEYVSKYQWPVTVRDGAFDAPYGAPTAGPPPYELYQISPGVVFAFGTDETFAPRSTRFRF